MLLGHQISRDEAEPVLDYDDTKLFDISYEQLKAEQFDYIPRLKSPFLSEDLRQQPLERRLEHVQKNIDPIHQPQFFQELTTKEWEEAGDWFLDRFSDLVNRTRQARQTKRKLAQDFENRVDQRHQHVQKKRHIIDEALHGMKTKGANLIPPRTPRSSKSPAQSKAK